jgi:hypothetical protein
MGVSFASRFSMLIRLLPKRVISRNKTSITIDRNAVASPRAIPLSAIPIVHDNPVYDRQALADGGSISVESHLIPRARALFS